MTEDPQLLIQKLRVQRGWSQEQLAELTGLSVRTIQRIERGQNASVESLKALAAVFEVDFSTLRETAMDTALNTANTAIPHVSADEALALAQVRKIKGFYMHLAQYGVVIAFLVVVNLLTSPRHFWAVWPALGWGVAVLLHGLRVFDKVPFLNGEWEKRQVEKRLGRQL